MSNTTGQYKQIKVSRTPLAQLTDQVQRLDIQVAKACGIAEVNKRSLLRLETKLEQQHRDIRRQSARLERMVNLLERFGWIILGFVVVVLLASVVAAVTRVWG